MRKTLAIAARELRERWILFPGGLVLGCVPLVLPAFGLVPPIAEPTLGLLIATLLGTLSALVAGATMLARDAADGRLGFLFSRPVSWPAIWGGKWLAATVLVTGCTALAALPWMLAHPPPTPDGSWSTALADPQGSVFFLTLLLIAIGLANLNAAAYRSRSTWLAVDLGVLLLALWAARAWVAPLFSDLILGYTPLHGWGFLLLTGPPAVALFAASVPQVALGRTDLRRAHRAMSIAFWAVVWVSLAAAGGRLAWARAATPADLGRFISGSLDPSGRWLCASGHSRRGGVARFLVDTGSGDYLAQGLASRWGLYYSQQMAFDAGGRVGALLSADDDGSAFALADLTGSEPRFRWVSLESSPPPDHSTFFTLSASGGTALLAHRHGVSLFALPSGRRVATATVPPGWRPTAVRMLDESSTRVWLSPAIDAHLASLRGTMQVLEVAVGRDPRLTSFSLEVAVGPVLAWPIPDPSGGRLLTRDGGMRLRDGATGELLATLVETSAPVSATFVADGRIALAQAVGARTLVRVFGPDGTPLDAGGVTLDRVPMGLIVGPETAPGRVAIFFGPMEPPGDSVVFDLDEGKVVQSLPGQRPIGGWWWWSQVRGSDAGLPKAQIFLDGNAIVRVDLATGERRVVAGPGAHSGERLTPADVGLER